MCLWVLSRGRRGFIFRVLILEFLGEVLVIILFEGVGRGEIVFCEVD